MKALFLLLLTLVMTITNVTLSVNSLAWISDDISSQNSLPSEQSDDETEEVVELEEIEQEIYIQATKELKTRYIPKEIFNSSQKNFVQTYLASIFIPPSSIL